MTDRKRSIGMVEVEIGLKQHVIRFWEKHFPQIRPSFIGSGNRRYYCEKDIENILKIKYFLYEKKYTVDGLKEFLDENKDIFRKKLEEIKEILKIIPSQNNGDNNIAVFPTDKMNKICNRLKEIQAKMESIINNYSAKSS